jgi:hypothetical protein
MSALGLNCDTSVGASCSCSYKGRFRRTSRMVGSGHSDSCCLIKLPCVPSFTFPDAFTSGGNWILAVPVHVPLRSETAQARNALACKLDLEGMVAKHKFGLYAEGREQSTWVKILNRNYSQKLGREELFERDRQEPVPGWHTCDAACRKND